eukprot:3503369-Amphidinium_carterae.1
MSCVLGLLSKSRWQMMNKQNRETILLGLLIVPLDSVKTAVMHAITKVPIKQLDREELGRPLAAALILTLQNKHSPPPTPCPNLWQWPLSSWYTNNIEDYL